MLGKIVTFLNKEDLDKIAKYIADKGDYESLQYIISFVGKDTLEEIAEQAKKDGKSDELQYMVHICSMGNSRKGECIYEKDKVI